MTDFAAIILAAGQGTRFKSCTPKVLHSLAGRPLFEYSVRAALGAGAKEVVIVASPDAAPLIRTRLEQVYPEAQVSVVIQERVLGTGDAAYVGGAHARLPNVLVLHGDMPLVDVAMLKMLIAAMPERDGGQANVISVLTAELCERAEPDSARRGAGVIAAEREPFLLALAALRDGRPPGEWALESLVQSLAARQLVASLAAAPESLAEVSDRRELEAAEQLLFQRIRARHRSAGVTVRGDARIDDTVVIDSDAVIEAGVALRGKTRVGAGTTIDVGSVITDATLGQRVLVKAYSVISESRVADAAQIGPFAHLRPESAIGEGAHVGNFVETKKTRLGRGAKANHLAYLGDGEVGDRANIGAGTIFCNYDGFRKHKTVVEADAFIGSDSQLVAPVRVGERAYVGTGSTVTEDVPDDALAIGRARQVNKPGYAGRLRERLGAQKKA